MKNSVWDYWRILAITVDYWSNSEEFSMRLLENTGAITGDYWSNSEEFSMGLLENTGAITGDYCRLLE